MNIELTAEEASLVRYLLAQHSGIGVVRMQHDLGCTCDWCVKMACAGPIAATTYTSLCRKMGWDDRKDQRCQTN